VLAGASTEEQMACPDGLLAELTKRLLERTMEVELTDHVGYEPHCEPSGSAGPTEWDLAEDVDHRAREGCASRLPAIATGVSSRRSSASAGVGSMGLTKRSSRFGLAGFPRGIALRISRRYTA
jgi:hypothetical protein